MKVSRDYDAQSKSVEVGGESENELVIVCHAIIMPIHNRDCYARQYASSRPKRRFLTLALSRSLLDVYLIMPLYSVRSLFASSPHLIRSPRRAPTSALPRTP